MGSVQIQLPRVTVLNETLAPKQGLPGHPPTMIHPTPTCDPHFKPKGTALRPPSHPGPVPPAEGLVVATITCVPGPQTGRPRGTMCRPQTDYRLRMRAAGGRGRGAGSAPASGPGPLLQSPQRCTGGSPQLPRRGPQTPPSGTPRRPGLRGDRSSGMGPLCTHSTSPCKEQNRHAFRGTTRPRRQETQIEKERGRNEKRDTTEPHGGGGCMTLSLQNAIASILFK